MAAESDVPPKQLSAMFSFAFKCALSLGSLAAGYALDFIGFQAGVPVEQGSTAAWRLCAVTLLVGPMISLIALGIIAGYPINKSFIEQIRK